MVPVSIVKRSLGFSLGVAVLAGSAAILVVISSTQADREAARDQQLLAQAAQTVSRLNALTEVTTWPDAVHAVLAGMGINADRGCIQVLVPIPESDRRWRVITAVPERPSSSLPSADPQVQAAASGPNHFVTWIDPAGESWRSAVLAGETTIGHHPFMVEARLPEALRPATAILVASALFVGGVGIGLGSAWWLLRQVRRQRPAGENSARAADPDRATEDLLTTKRLRQQREIADLRVQVARFQGADRAKTTLLVALCRSLRQSVEGLRGTGLMLSQTRLDRIQLDQIEALQAGHGDLATRIGDVLDFALLEADCLSLDQRPLRPRMVLEEALIIVAERCAQLPVELVWEADSNVPERVIGDLARIRQVLVNLIGLAAATAEEGTVAVILTTDSPQQLTFTISLMGVTLTADRIRLLLEGAISSESSSAQLHSDGLGLVLGKRLAQAMGGSLGIDRGDQSDIRLTCTLQVSPDQIEPERPLQGIGIILAHERPAILHMLQAILVRAGALVTLSATHDELIAVDGQAHDQRLLLASSRILTADDAVEPFAVGEGVRRFAAGRPLVVVVDQVHRGFAGDLRVAGAKALISQPIRQQALLNAIHAATNEPVRESWPVPILSGHPDPTRVLIVEDNQVNQLVLIRVLESLGISPEVAHQGQEAVDLVHVAGDRPFSLIFMDCMMPVLDGFAATQAIRRHEAARGGRRAWIIAVTANALAHDRQRCLDTGMDDYLAKPVTPAALGEVLARWRQLTRVPAVSPGALAVGVPFPAPEGDFSGLDTLVRLAGRPAMIEVVNCFLVETEAMHQQIVAAAAAKDWDRLRAAAHKLKGSCATVGLKKLLAQVVRIEVLARSGSDEALAAELATLIPCLADSLQQLSAYRDQVG